jgi:iron-sulfur cluster assembly accessory protein
MIQLTDNAVAAIKTAISRASANAAPDARSAEGLRIMVHTGGCAGFKYMMGLEVETRDGDEVVRQSGVTLFVDSESQPHLAGMTVDFVSGLESSGFVFDNPNASSKCSCGKSFS